MVGIAEQPGVIQEDIGRYRIQDLFEFQVIVIPDPLPGKRPVIYLAEADNTILIQGQAMVF